MHYPKISIIVPTYNEVKYIEKCLNSLLNQTYKGEFEIIVIDGGSKDNTLQIVKAISNVHSNIIILENPKRIQSAGRNIGINYSKSDYIAYIDAHSYPQLDWLEKLWTTYCDLSEKDESIAGVSSIYYDAQDTSFSRSLSYAYRSYLIGSSKNSFLNAKEITKVDNGYAFLYKKEALLKAGLYDESLKTAEDIELNFRLSYKLGYSLYVEPKARTYYYFKENPLKIFAQQFRYGFWRVQAMKKIGKYSLKVFIPAFALLILLFLIIGTISYFNGIRFLAIALGLYLILMVIGSIFESIKNKVNFFYFLINVISIQFGYGCGVFAGAIFSLFRKK